MNPSVFIRRFCSSTIAACSGFTSGFRSGTNFWPIIPVAPRTATFLLFAILVVLQRGSDQLARLFPDVPVDEDEDGGCYGEDAEYVDVTRAQRVAYSRDDSRRLFQANSFDCDEGHSHPGGKRKTVRVLCDYVVESGYLSS